MRTLVLGGSVFVGKRLVRHLVAAGHDVSVLNRGVTGTALPPGVGHLRADRTDPAQMEAALADEEWDAVYDVSGFVMVAGAGDIDGLLDRLDGRTGHYVFVSSIMAYDQSWLGIVPWTEDQPADRGGLGTYGGFKAVCEAAILSRHRRTGFPGTVVRPAAIYGPDNNIFDMETPMFLRLLQRRPVLVPHAGLVTASYGHVDDLCRAMTDLTANPATFGEILNATAEAVTSERYVRVLAEIVGVEPDLRYLPDAVLAAVDRAPFGHLFGRRHHAVLATDKLTRLTGHRPEHDFRRGHEQTFEWFRAQGWDRLAEPLADPVWRASWDFEHEAAVAERLCR